jgi:hypothetical protein
MSAATESVPSEAEILSHVIRPDRGTWSRAAAEAILSFDFPPEDLQRMNTLAAKAREGSLSTGGQAELEGFFCNTRKGPNLSGLDPQTGELTRLFHPRQDRWQDHFRWEGSPRA